MKKTILFFFVLCALIVNAQEDNSIDFCTEIKKVITDSTSLYFYPLLLDKVKNNPESIDVMDCYYLYYGQIFQSNYKPLSFIANPERGDFDKASVNGRCKKVIQLGETILERNPVELTVLLHISVCIDKQIKYTDKDYFSQRFRNLLSAIFMTGNGTSKEKAIKIVNMEDDYILKGIVGFLGGEESLMFDQNRAYSVWSKGNNKLYFEDVMNIENIKVPQ